LSSYNTGNIYYYSIDIYGKNLWKIYSTQQSHAHLIPFVHSVITAGHFHEEVDKVKNGNFT
jgi:hypothetical protein